LLYITQNEKSKPQEVFVKTILATFLTFLLLLPVSAIGEIQTVTHTVKQMERGRQDHRPDAFDLSVKNPNGGEEVTHRSPQAIMNEIAALDAESAEVLQTIRGLL
jgi:hypothetical protein